MAVEEIIVTSDSDISEVIEIATHEEIVISSPDDLEVVEVQDPDETIEVISPPEEEVTVTIDRFDDLEVIQVGIPGAPGAGIPTKKWSVKLTPGHTSYEVEPGILEIPFGTWPGGAVISLADALVVLTFIDGRFMVEGDGWELSPNGLALRIDLPVDPGLRARYLNGVEYRIHWAPTAG